MILVTDSAVAIKTSEITNGANVKNTGTGSAGLGVNIVGDGSVKVSHTAGSDAAASKITITGENTKYGLKTDTTTN